MAHQSLHRQPLEPKGRAMGSNEHSWCSAVAGGTGITVLALLGSKEPDISDVQNALHKLQISHPILRSKLHFDTTTNTHSFVTSPTPFLQIKSLDHSSTSHLLKSIVSNRNNPSNITPFHLILEHELNQNTWNNPSHSSNTNADVFFATLYALPDTKWSLVLRFHTAACDRTTAVTIMRELHVLFSDGGEIEREKGNKGEVSLGIEDLIPGGKGKKGLWARGVDMLGYSVNSLRLTNLKFKDAKSPRSSEVVRLKMNLEDTQRLLAGCRSRGIKLCGALAAAGLIAAQTSKRKTDHQRKYGVLTLTDCRSILDPPLSCHHFGFYHSAILNILSLKGSESLWELARRSYVAFATSKNGNKHFSDMADLNFLMCKAIDNPSLTSSSSLRSSFISVFEDAVIDDDSSGMQGVVGLEDYIGCASIHGIGPSIAIFDTIRDGQLDCACVYPSPLHSREQMQELVDNMKSVLVEAGHFVE
ncbi:hypothetical protein L1049_009350 [Liquidambar formosana]|uniref:Uncharacterized protein n=1 Tax=Liquidambar formosana TaxID=63359 RepID=A0AAP0S5X7_LIQFO